MKNDDKSLNERKIYRLFMIFSIIILCFCSYFYIKMGLNNKKKMVLEYQSTSDINYRVFLKENNFFNEEYLGMNKTYIASLIDYLDVVFTYNLKYSEIVSGEYKYYIKATIYADKDASSKVNYWSKSYNLTEPETIKFEDAKDFIVTSRVVVDYQKYSDLLKEFRKQYGLSINGFLKLELVVESDSKSELMEKDVRVNSLTELSIPLTEQAVELSIDTESNISSGEVVEEVVLEDIKYRIYLDLGIAFAVLSIILFIIFTYDLYLSHKSKSKYIKELKKILSTYDSIIVNTVNMPNFDKYKVICVNSFNELIDAHSEVRMPINYIELEPSHKSIFVLINGDIAWVYMLKEEDYKKRQKR